VITVGNRWVLYNGRVRLSFPGFLLLVIFLTVVAAGFRVGPFAKVLGARAEKLILVAVGDVMLGRSVNVSMQRRNDWRWPFLVWFSCLGPSGSPIRARMSAGWWPASRFQ